MISKYATALIAIGLAVSATGAIAQTVYRYKDSKGNTVYTDNPSPGSGAAERLEIPAQPATPSARGLSAEEKRTLEAADRRVAELNRASEDIVTAFNALRAAEARRDQGIEPREGERSGRRFRSAYWDRQQALERDVEAARARLDEAIARRNASR